MAPGMWPEANSEGERTSMSCDFPLGCACSSQTVSDGDKVASYRGRAGGEEKGFKPQLREDNGGVEVDAMEDRGRASGFRGPWLLLTVGFALHVLDEATTGFLNVYNPTVLAMRARWAWFPMPTFQFREWLVGLCFGVVLCFAVTPLAARNVGLLRPPAWFYALIMFFNGMGHTVFTILGRTVASVTFPRPAPGFYSSPLLLGASAWLMMRLWRTRAGPAS